MTDNFVPIIDLFGQRPQNQLRYLADCDGKITIILELIKSLAIHKGIGFLASYKNKNEPKNTEGMIKNIINRRHNQLGFMATEVNLRGEIGPGTEGASPKITISKPVQTTEASEKLIS